MRPWRVLTKLVLLRAMLTVFATSGQSHHYLACISKISEASVASSEQLAAQVNFSLQGLCNSTEPEMKGIAYDITKKAAAGKINAVAWQDVCKLQIKAVAERELATS